jgi:hypothetical protein
VNSGSYLRTVFVFISGITTFTGLGGTAGFLGSVLMIGLAVTGGVGGIGTGLLATTGAACLTGAAAGVTAGCLSAVCDFDWLEPEEWAFETFAGTAGLDILETAGFFVDTGADLAGVDTVFLAGGNGATFLASGLAILLDTGAFLADLLPPDDWADLEAAFLAGTIFLTLVGFLAGLAAFFLVAIQLGFFSNKHF